MLPHRSSARRASLLWPLAPILAAGLVAACAGDDDPSVPPVNADEDTAYLGGRSGTVFDSGKLAFSRAVPGLDADERRQFTYGNTLFGRNWVTAPSSVSGGDGLGPTFNATACGGCHFNDGRGLPPVNGTDFVGVLLRLSVPGDGPHGGPLGDPNYGDQLQTAGIHGVPHEATPRVTYQELPGQLADGTPYSLRKPSYTLEEPQFGPFAAGLMVSPRIAPQICGLGLLEAVDEATILQLADPDDRDGDGISGRANWVYHHRSGETRLGRFGWKANQPDIEQQTAAAFHGDIGMTTSMFPEQNCPSPQVACQQAPHGGDGDEAEIAEFKLEALTFYNHVLAVPARRDLDSSEAREGERVFGELGCGGCHVQRMPTSASPSLPALQRFANDTLRPYTDLLLHDMGEGLADGRPDFLADGREWRTPPLWGLGLVPRINRGRFLLHDGRARSFEEAILWHGGEAQRARDAYAAAPKAQREALMQFLESL